MTSQTIRSQTPAIHPKPSNPPDKNFSKRPETPEKFVEMQVLPKKIEYGDNTDGDNSLHTLIRQNQVEALKNSLQSMNNNTNLNLNQPNKEGFTPFTLAVLKSEACAKLFLEEKCAVDVNSLFPKIGSTPLTEAIRAEKRELSSLLINYKNADLNKPATTSGLTPLITAFFKRNIKIAALLVRNSKVLINQHSYKNKFIISNNESVIDFLFPSLVAIDNSFNEELELLCQHDNLSINEQTKILGLSAIHLALINKNLPAVRLLLNLKDAKKLNINIQTKDGLAPLHIACQNNILEIIREILDYPETNVNIKTNDKKSTPLHLAVMESKTDVVQILLNSHKVDIFADGTYGSALNIANLQTDGKMKNIFKNHLKSNFLIDFSISNIINLSEKGDIPISTLNVSEEFNLLKKAKERISSLQFIQINKTHLCTDSNVEKIAFVRFTEDIIIIDLYDYLGYEDYLFVDYRCQITNMPISNYLDFPTDNLKNKCYILGKSIVYSIEQILN